MQEEYKILGSRWYTPSTPSMSGVECIGIVAVETFTDEWKAYIGVGEGIGERSDAQDIARSGAGMLPEEACGFFPHLNIDQYKRDG